jgi:hypothetical protein
MSERMASIAASSLGSSPVGSHGSATSGAASHCHGLSRGSEYENPSVPSRPTMSDGAVPSCGPTIQAPSRSSGAPSTPSAAASAATVSGFDAARAS